MLLRSLRLKNFRIYSEKHVEFSPRVNVICGPNACGKTTILEALHLLMTGRSFRTSRLQDLIREGASFFSIEAWFLKHGIEQSLAFSYDGKERRIFYHNTPCHTLSGLLGLLQGATMIPEDVALIKGAPRVRRAYLDLQLAQVDPLYVHHLKRYHRAMRQRNHLLRQKAVKTIETWEHEMAKAAVYLLKQRVSAVKELDCLSQKVMQTLVPDIEEKLSLDYQVSIKHDQEQMFSYYLEHYRKMRQKEMRIGYTLCGPHRDDLHIFLEGKEARYFSSEGQQRSCIAALRFAEWERLNRLAEDSPVMLIDDMGVNLDQARRDKLIVFVGSLQQVLLTMTEEPAAVAPQHVIRLS